MKMLSRLETSNSLPSTFSPQLPARISLAASSAAYLALSFSIALCPSVSQAQIAFRPFTQSLIESSISRAKSNRSPDASNSNEIGQLVNVVGDVQVRLPRQVRFKKAADSSSLVVQEMIATHGAKSEASLTLDSGAVIRVLGNSRVVAEHDPNHEGSLIITILSGDVELKKGPTSVASSKGASGAASAQENRLHFIRDGRELDIKVGQKVSLVPVIGVKPNQDNVQTAHAGANSTANAQKSVSSTGAVVPTTSAPSEAAPAVTGSTVTETGTSNSAAPVTNEKGTRLTLGNDDISKQVKSQMSFFQRCYLNYLSRSTSAQSKAGAASGGANSKTPAAGSGPNGAQVVVLGFTIQNTGRVTQTHIVRSDIQDVTLQKCLAEVLGRTSFRSFAGDDIEVSEYPIVLQ